MNKPDYFAKPYNEEDLLVQSSSRTSGDYSIQMCEVEVVLEQGTLETLTFDMQVGYRTYLNNDATAFNTTREPSFEWYRKNMEFSDELKEEPVYEKETKQEKKQAEEKFEMTVESVFDQFLEAYYALLEEL